tara:strand:- start:4137 stop:5288 length:1152 start_codon:yes stop_codon:yes gene_type:complete
MEKVIISNNELINNLKLIENEEYIAIDTEFIRDTSYFSKLCLIQVASKRHNFIIDPLAEDIDLSLFWNILVNNSILKIFHSGRQDLEIFYNMFGKLPSPIYDTQIAAMVCGYGDQISYEHLVFDLLNIKIDKSSRVSNWSYRPLSNKQISYALSDVTHLVDLFRILKKKILANDREKWIEEDMNNLSNIENYKLKPDEAWKKIKYKSFKSENINRLKFLAEWREHLSINRNVTKNKIARDEVLLEIASNDPKDINDFSRIRGLKLDKNKNIIEEILQTLEKARDVPKEQWPTKNISKKNKINKPAVLELLKVLLKHVSEKNKVAPKLIAKQIDLEIIASGDKNNIKIFQGWRYEIFGKLVENLIEGKIAIKIQNGKLLILNNI